MSNHSVGLFNTTNHYRSCTPHDDNIVSNNNDRHTLRPIQPQQLQQQSEQQQRLPNHLYHNNDKVYEYNSNIEPLSYRRMEEHDDVQQQKQQELGGGSDDIRCTPTTSSTSTCSEVGSGIIDITKSLYHLRLHGFDVVTKRYQQDRTTSSTLSSPEMDVTTTSCCVTPAVSPIRTTSYLEYSGTSSGKKRSILQSHAIVSSSSSSPVTTTVTNKPISRPLSPLLFLDDMKTPSAISKNREQNVISTTTEWDIMTSPIHRTIDGSNDSYYDDTLVIVNSQGDSSISRTMCCVASTPYSSSVDTNNGNNNNYCIPSSSPKNRHRTSNNNRRKMIRSTMISDDELDEFEVMMLESSSVSTEDDDEDNSNNDNNDDTLESNDLTGDRYNGWGNDKDNNNDDLRNTSSIFDSPHSHSQYEDMDDIIKNDNNDDDNISHCNDSKVSPGSPQTPAPSTFCGSIPNWCDTSNINNTMGNHQNLLLDYCATTPTTTTTTAIPFKYRSGSNSMGDDWFCPPTMVLSAPECCTTSNDDLPSVQHQQTYHDGSHCHQITVMQNLLQSHICASLGDGFETLCWQQSATSIFPKPSLFCFTQNDSCDRNTTMTSNSISYLPDDDEDSPILTDSPDKTNEGDIDTTSKTKHRRSSTLPANRRTDKFKSLRYNLYPFDDDVELTRSRVPSSITKRSGLLSSHTHLPPNAFNKSQSFQYIPSTQQQLYKVSNMSKKKCQSEVGFGTSEWECGVLDFASVYDDNDEIAQQHLPQRYASNDDTNESNDEGYESDPELFCRPPDNQMLGRVLNDKSTGHVIPTTILSSYTLQEFLNERCTFIWHPNATGSTSNINSSGKSVAVHVWIELGQQLHDSLVLPKLCWKPILQQQDIHNNKSNKKINNLTNCVGGTVSSIELLNISRILPVTNSNREQYPFALTQRLFSIQSGDASSDAHLSFGDDTQTTINLILEARSIADRVRYMNLLKLTVSTLATKYITNDPTTFTMFFHNPSFSDIVG